MKVPQEGLPSVVLTMPHILHPISEGEGSLLLSKNSLAIKFATPHTSPVPKTLALPFDNSLKDHTHPWAKGGLPRMALALDAQIWIQVQVLPLTSCLTLSPSFCLYISVPTSAKWKVEITALISEKGLLINEMVCLEGLSTMLVLSLLKEAC